MYPGTKYMVISNIINIKYFGEKNEQGEIFWEKEKVNRKYIFWPQKYVFLDIFWLKICNFETKEVVKYKQVFVISILILMNPNLYV